jgi:hypothetical protein
MATTSAFGWETPDDTDLVKDGAAAIRTLGSSIDTSMAELKGGTTGQVLSKTSNTDMDFTWVAQDDSNAIQNAIVDAKGDLIAASAADTPARLAVGNNGETLVADSSASTGLRWQGDYAAGKNKIINGDFSVWQRGTTVTFANPTSGGFVSDRWQYLCDDGGASSGSKTISQQTFTPGAAPVAGYEGQFFIRVNSTVASSTETYSFLAQLIEDVRTFAGQTITISFWAKAAANTTMQSLAIRQSFGSGGSSAVDTTVTTSIAVTTSWQRFSYSVAVPSVSGKTIGASSFLRIGLFNPTQATFTLDFWGVQVEAGSVATAFQTATGTIQGELSACQRYFYNHISNGTLNTFGIGYYYNSTELQSVISFPVTMRTAPTLIATSGSNYYSFERANGSDGIDSWTIQRPSLSCSAIKNTTDASGTGGEAGTLEVRNASASISFSAEL